MRIRIFSIVAVIVIIPLLILSVLLFGGRNGSDGDADADSDEEIPSFDESVLPEQVVSPFLDFESSGVDPDFLRALSFSSSSLDETPRLFQQEGAGTKISDNVMNSGDGDKKQPREDSRGGEEIEGFKAYGNELALLITTYVGDQKTIAEHIGNFAENPAPQTAQKVRGIAQKYKGVYEEMFRLRVPEQAREFHDAYREGFQAVADALEAFSESSQSTFQEQAKSYNDAALLLAREHFSLINFFKVQGVVFSSNEPGYMFSNPFE